MFESKVGMILIAKPIVIELFGKLKKDEVIEMAAREGKNVVRDITLFMKDDINLESFLY
jgi:hypothetical protein